MLIQIIFDIFAALGFFLIIMRMNRAPKDDPRLSRGLQLLQSKISVLEDLSDRTETQVTQLTAILDQKSKEVQAKVQLAEQHVQAIRVSMERSLEVAKIFQDKIPHQEIIERQNTKKYVQAARLAHQGLEIDEIAKQVDLPKGEIEFITKVNRDQLMFSEDQLPWWAQEAGAASTDSNIELTPPAALGHLSFESAPTEDPSRRRAEMEIAERQRLVDDLNRLQTEMHNLDVQLARQSTIRDLSGAFESVKVETGSLQKLGEEFRKAVDAANHGGGRNSVLPPLEQLTALIPQVFSGANGDEATAAAELSLSTESEADMPSLTVPLATVAPAPVEVKAEAPQANPNVEQAQAKVDEPMPVVPAAATASPASSAPAAAIPVPQKDPILAKAMAKAKVQAALDRGAAKFPVKPNATEISPELAAARAIANEAAAEPVVRKVQFPRIEMPKN